MNQKVTQQLGFFIDVSRCSGCRACQVACQDKNNLDTDRAFRRVHEVRSGEFIPIGESAAYRHNVFAYAMSVSCNHCDDPICVKNCPTTAMTKRAEDGIVFVDSSKCIGCGYCAWSCPYGAPQMNQETKQMSKCDFCFDLLTKNQSPACVDACPLHVIEFGLIDELRKEHGALCDVKGLPASQTTKPNLVIKPHENHQTGEN